MLTAVSLYHALQVILKIYRFFLYACRLKISARYDAGNRTDSVPCRCLKFAIAIVIAIAIAISIAIGTVFAIAISLLI